MIASGLCMMGGCFAQDSAGAAVVTYWHAHSIAPQFLMQFSAEMPMVPCVSEGYWLFGRLEEISNINSGYVGQMIFWGTWNITDYHTFLLGCKDGAYASLQGTHISERSLQVKSSQPVKWEEVQVSNMEFVLSAEFGQASADLRGMNTFETPDGTWRPRMTNAYGDGKVSAYAMRAPAGGIRFAIQPMLSPQGNSAFFDIDNAELIEQ